MNSNFYIPQLPHIKSGIGLIWQVDGFTSFEQEQIIPKGVIEIIFNFSEDVIAAEFGNEQYHLPRCFINGINTAPIQIRLPKKQVFFGVQFQPLAVRKIFKTPASEFADMAVDLSLIDRELETLWHQLADQKDFDRRVITFCDWIEKKYIDLQPREQLLNQFLSGVDQHDLSVTELSGLMCYSSRQLSRKIAEVTGMNTEETLLYKKYLHAVHLIHHTDLPLTKIAYQSNFSDQSHFIKSFKAYTHLTPGEYSRNKSFVKGHIYGNVR